MIITWTSSECFFFLFLRKISPWRSMSIAPYNKGYLNQGLSHLWSKFRDPSLNGWWAQTDTHTRTQAMTIPRGQSWSPLKTSDHININAGAYCLTRVSGSHHKDCDVMLIWASHLCDGNPNTYKRAYQWKHWSYRWGKSNYTLITLLSQLYNGNHHTCNLWVWHIFC